MKAKGSKWSKIVEKLNVDEVCQCHKNGATCKYKWQTMLSKYKKIVDYYKCIGINSLEYFNLDKEEVRELALLIL